MLFRVIGVRLTLARRRRNHGRGRAGTSLELDHLRSVPADFQRLKISSRLDLLILCYKWRVHQEGGQRHA